MLLSLHISSFFVGVVTPALVPSNPLTLIGTTKQPVISNSSKVACLPSSDKKDDINVMPASVEDHFAKALGDQWSKLSSESPPDTLKT